jgi:hypothetical protein
MKQMRTQNVNCRQPRETPKTAKIGGRPQRPCYALHGVNKRTVKASNRKICLSTDAVSSLNKKSQQQQQKMTLLSILELLKENWAH